MDAVCVRVWMDLRRIFQASCAPLHSHQKISKSLLVKITLTFFLKKGMKTNLCAKPSWMRLAKLNHDVRDVKE